MTTTARTLTSRQLAAKFGRQRNWIDSKANAGAIPYTLVKRQRRYNFAEVRKVLAELGAPILSRSCFSSLLNTKDIKRIEEGRMLADIERKEGRRKLDTGAGFLARLHGGG